MKNLLHKNICKLCKIFFKYCKPWLVFRQIDIFGRINNERIQRIYHDLVSINNFGKKLLAYHWVVVYQVGQEMAKNFVELKKLIKGQLYCADKGFFKQLENTEHK